MAASLDVGSVLLWGIFATGILTVVLAASQVLGWTRLSLPFLLGTLFTAHRDAAMLAGAALHGGLGCAFAFLYALVFEAWHRASWWLGGLLGLYHGLFMLVVVLPLLPHLHPRMASRYRGPSAARRIEPPGFLGRNYGWWTAPLTLLAHVAYGLLLGLFYPLGGG
jgi:hypothetical protein